MIRILPPIRETIVKAVVLVLACLVPSMAGTLVTGVVRDDRGAPVPGARVAVLQASGSLTPSGRVAPDGTFALDADRPTSILVQAPFCEPARASVAANEPVIILLRCYPAVAARTPSRADLAALPYRSATALAALVPLTLRTGGSVSDRGLDHGRGALTVDGLPFYRASDGRSAATLLPAAALVALAVRSPLDAPRYGTYANGGGFDFETTGTGNEGRIDAGDAFDAALHLSADGAAATYARSSDAGDLRQVGAFRLAQPFAGGRLTLDALAFADAYAHASGVGMRYATGSRRYETFAAVSATAEDGTIGGWSGPGSTLAADMHVRNRGPWALDLGMRAARSLAPGGAQVDGAVYAAMNHAAANNVIAASLALERASDDTRASASRAGALVWSVGDDERLSGQWSWHLGAASSVRIPTLDEVRFARVPQLASERSLLTETSLEYTDGRRLRLAAVAYEQHARATQATSLRGFGIDGGWQIAPLLSLRTWALRSNEETTAAMSPGTSPAYVYYAPTQPSALHRQLVWLSYGAAFRADLLVRNGPLEGDLVAPLGAHVALAIGTQKENRTRVTTFGLRLR